jgi:hypothetical protein
VPRRSNLFQDVVTVVHQLLADGAEVEESAMLVHCQTDDPREVDVVVRSTVVGQQVVIGIEASAAMRPADVKWVEQLISKHQQLPTDKLVLVSEHGYSKQARRLAEANSVALVELNDLGEETLEAVIVNKLPSLWPKAVRLAPERVIVETRPPGAEAVTRFVAFPDTELLHESGARLGTLKDYVDSQLSRREFIFEQINLADITESMDRWFTAGAMRPTLALDDRVSAIYCRFVRDDGSEELHPIEKIEIVGRARIEVQEMSLVHKRLGDVAVSYGEVQMFEARTATVVTSCGGREVVTTRVHKGGNVTEFSEQLDPSRE